MKKSALDFLVCPLCKNEFKLVIFEEREDNIESGILECGCGQKFPIIKSIPRILVGNMEAVVYDSFPDFFIEHKDFFAPKISQQKKEKSEQKKKKTAESFAYEWKKFSKMIKEWEYNFNWYFVPLENFHSLKDGVVLEVGCGKGRHTHYVSKYAKEVVSVDLGGAIDVADANNKADNIHFVQADIYNLPFRENFFDFIFSLGVLHHLPTPEEGFKKILSFLKLNEQILLYVYHSFPKTTLNYYLLKMVTFVRYFTIRIPRSALYFLCYPIAFLSYLIFVLPYKMVSKLNIKKINESRWPLKLYSDYPIEVLINDTFDRFSAPIENRYSKEQIVAWYERANLSNVKILGSGGWRIIGTKNI